MADGSTAAPVLRRLDAQTVAYTLNRPKALNALNGELLRQLRHEIDEAFADPSVRVVVIDGAGDRAFCAGADLDELAGLDSAGALELLSRGQRLFRRIEQAAKPVIAAVDGYALGGGFELALACHFIVATDRARFGLPEATLGLIPGYGGTQRLVAAAGRQTALRVMLSGNRLTAAEADAAGLLAMRPVSPEDLPTAVSELAGQLCSATPAATAAVLSTVRDTATPPSLGLSLEAASAAISISSEAGQAGIRSFLSRSRA